MSRKYIECDRLLRRAIPFNQYRPTRIIVAPSAMYLNNQTRN